MFPCGWQACSLDVQGWPSVGFMQPASPVASESLDASSLRDVPSELVEPSGGIVDEEAPPQARARPTPATMGPKRKNSIRQSSASVAPLLGPAEKERTPALNRGVRIAQRHKTAHSLCRGAQRGSTLHKRLEAGQGVVPSLG